MAPSTFGASTTAAEAAGFYADRMAGKVVLITGATPKGLGAEAARVIALHNPELLILAGRSQANLDKSVTYIRHHSPQATLQTLLIDFSSLTSVRLAASIINASSQPIDILILNHGITGAPYTLTQDGFESNFAIHHLGPFLFRNLIKPRLFASAEARVVVVSSSAVFLSNVNFEDPGWDEGRGYEKWKAYAASKTANIQFVVGLARRWKGVGCFSLHPGACLETNIFNNTSKEEMMAVGFLLEDGTPNPAFQYKTVEACAATHIVASFDPDLKDHSGEFLADCQLNTTIPVSYTLDSDNAEKLWALSEKMVGQKFD
ncbi:NAD(P)-binding protein [Pseudohyphozyma bogoriensis]|nr:NAD(P)-binding protein [Pseudohyphozyma bogoriensis]